MDTLVIDFETYYDPKDYSLSKMTSTEYIRDPRFQAICCAFKFNDEATHLAWGKEDIQKAFNFYGTNVRAVAHNAQFDGAIAAHHFDWHPEEWSDTVGLARAQLRLKSYSLGYLAEAMGVAPKLDGLSVSKGKRLEDLLDYERRILGEYCIRDVDICYAIYSKLIPTCSRFEFLLLQWTIKAVTQPMLEIDHGMLDNYVVELMLNRDKMLAEAGITRDVIMSNPKFAAALEAFGVKPPMKVSERTGKPTFAFAKDDKGITDLLQHDDVRVQTLVAARLKLKSTIEESRAQRLSAIGKTGKLPVPLLYYGAHTGRMSGGGGINLQNLTRGSKLRKAIIAPKGYALVVGDSSQIEARALALAAGQEDLVEVFRQGKDPYCDMASFIYGREITKADEDERWLGKVTVLGAGYGMSANTFFEFLRAQGKPRPMEMCQKAISAYRKKNDKIVRFWDTCDRALQKIYEGGNSIPLSNTIDVWTKPNAIKLPVGFPLIYPDLKYSASERRWSYMARGDGRSGIYGGLVTENIIQALARHVVMEQLLIVHDRYPVALTVHDEIVVVVPEAEAEEATRFVEKVMKTPPRWWPRLPVNAEVKWGYVYGEIK
jgi:DNA polymerase